MPDDDRPDPDTMDRRQALALGMACLTGAVERFRTQLKETQRQAAKMPDPWPLEQLIDDYKKAITSREQARSVLSRILEETN